MLKHHGNGSKSTLTQVSTEFALPHGYAVPAHSGQLPQFLGITLSVTVDFSPPELPVCHRHPEQSAVLMTVPEAPVDEYA